MKRNSKAAGISLVALVITIIVLIILTGAVIVTFMEGGIIDRAKESVFKNDMRTYQEILALKRAENQMEIALGEKEDVEINASTLAEIQEIIPEFKEEYEGLVVITDGELSIGERVTGEELSNSEELYATWLDDLGIGLSRLPKNALASYVEVGDYVDYNYTGETYTIAEGDRSWIWNDAKGSSSYTYETGEEKIEYQDINWKVLKNDGRQVTLISEDPIEKIVLSKKDGFIKGIFKLDEICETVYGGRNLNIKDVIDVLGVEPIIAYYNSDMERVYKSIGATFGEVIEEDGYDVSSWDLPEDYEELEIAGYFSKPNVTEENRTAINLIFTSTDYWLSSRCADVYFGTGGVSMCVYCHLSPGQISGIEVWGNNPNFRYGLRPVVTLSVDTEVSNPTAGGDTSDTAWKLK